MAVATPRSGRGSSDGLFDCNICLEPASDPVVTMCGHLYCWGCLYKWLRVRNDQPTCPICKTEVSRERLVPIYGRGRPHIDPRNKEVVDDEMRIPDRPAAASRPPAAEHDGSAAAAASALSSAAAATAESGFDALASLFGLRVAQPGNSNVAVRGTLSREEEQQAFLSRVLLLLGSLVIMCLLIF